MSTEEHESAIDDIRLVIEDLQDALPNFRDEVSRLEGMIWDLQSRIESIPY
jgi:hypothetical protein